MCKLNLVFYHTSIQYFSKVLPIVVLEVEVWTFAAETNRGIATAAATPPTIITPAKIIRALAVGLKPDHAPPPARLINKWSSIIRPYGERQLPDRSNRS